MRSDQLNLKEDAPTNAVGGGGVEGIGYGPRGEPGVYKKKRKTPMLTRKKPTPQRFSEFFDFQVITQLDK
jgi:hypothetical protein